MMNATQGQEVCLCVSILDGLIMARSAFNFNVNHRSVMVFGTAAPVTDSDEKHRQLKRFVDRLRAGTMGPVAPAHTQRTQCDGAAIDVADRGIRQGAHRSAGRQRRGLRFSGVGGHTPDRSSGRRAIPDPRNLPDVEMPAQVRDFKIG